LAEERSIFASVGVTLTGGDSEKWHRFDVHTSVILGVDEQQTARTLTIMQHNHQRTWIIGKDLPAELPVKLAVAFRSNEIYPDDGSAAIQRHRVVTSLLDWEYLFDAEKRPWLWAEDLVAGVGMGAQAMQMVPEFPAPDHPLASFPGLLAPPRRILGQYVGRDGPPGYDFYALPEFLAMPDITAMGYWQPGNQSQWLAIKTHLDGFKNSNWAAIRERLRIDLVKALSNDLK
jgi:hypothetical protein